MTRLYIGINYIGTQNQLLGCMNDARRWSKIFGPGLLLLEQNATKKNIIEAIKTLFQTPAEEYVITLSGHGTDIKDRGRENDTAFVPYDLDLIPDDMFNELLAETDKHILFITDCCHSGTMSRDGGLPRHWPGLKTTEQPRVTHPLPHVLHLSGCKDEEVSWDQTFNGVNYGNLTYHASATYDKSLTYNQWYDKLMRLIKKQTPQITGPTTRPVYGGATTPTNFPDIRLNQNGKTYVPTGWRISD